MPLGNFFKGFGKKPMTTALTVYEGLGHGGNSLMGANELKGRINSYIKRKALIGAGVGGIGGGGYGAATAEGDNAAPATIGDRVKGGLTGALGGAAVGGIGGAGYGFYRSVPVVKAYRRTKAGLMSDDIIGAAKDAEKSQDYNSARKVHDDITRMFRHAGPMAEDIAHRGGPVVGEDFFGRAKVLDKKEVANSIKNLSEDFDLHMSPFNNSQNIASHVLRGFSGAAKRHKGQVGVSVQNIVSNLKSQGITNHKDFAKKYHPDINKNVPLHIKNNYDKILETLKGGGGPAEGPFDLLHKKIYDEDQSAINAFHEQVRKRFG